MTKIAILGNYATQFFNKSLKKAFKGSTIEISIYEADFNTIDFEILNDASELFDFTPDYLIIHESDWAFKSEFYNRDHNSKANFYNDKIQTLESRIHKIANLLPNCKIIYPSLFLKNDMVYGNIFAKTKLSWFYQINNYNTACIELSHNHDNFFVIDSFSNMPFNMKFRDSFLINSSDLHFTIDYLDWLAQTIRKLIEANNGKFVKCIILDLDNTLWGGVIGDDGLNGIKIGDNGVGKAFSNLQKWLKQLKSRGIILAVCSKNEESIAQQPFNEHPEMVLRIDDIAIFIANWNSKADNINQIKEILNIGFDSMVFIDDNPAEREIVRKHLPEINVPELPSDVSEYLPFLLGLNLFETISISQNDEKRTIQYQEEAKRVQLAKSVTNMDDFLDSLEMTATIENFKELDYERLAQLSQRSNQYNLRTIRYTSNEIKAMATSNEYITFSVSLKDKFGDYGLISMIILKIDEQNEIFIDTWIMSCRVLKRTVEHLVMNTIAQHLLEKNLLIIKGEYLETAKNNLVRELLPSFGFKADDHKPYNFTLRISEYITQKNKYQKMRIEIEDLEPIFQEVFENENVKISEETKAADIEEWDSLNHIYLIVELEKQYRIKFTTNQIQGWQCVGDIVNDINNLV